MVLSKRGKMLRLADRLGRKYLLAAASLEFHSPNAVRFAAALAGQRPTRQNLRET
jgi:hypothetical protein